MTEERGIYLAQFHSRSGIENRLLLTCSLDDAKKFCSDDRTRGIKWMAIFNKLPERLTAKNFIKDDGRFDEVIEELGIEVKHWAEIKMEQEAMGKAS